MPARLASSVWVSPAASRRALIRSAKAALRGGTIKFFGFPFATSINVLRSPVCWLLPTNRETWVPAGVGERELRSDRCGWEELLAPGGGVLAEGRGALALGQGWSREWTTRWKFEGGPVVCLVRDLASMPVRGALPVRRFSWRTSASCAPSTSTVRGSWRRGLRRRRAWRPSW